ncbi:acetate--CoA ligase family protein [Chloroflexota bacterium]
MSNVTKNSLDFLFHPHSIALAGITVADPSHWTRVFLDALLEFKFERPIYLVNPKGGEIGELKVYPRLEDIPDAVDYVISTVPAKAGPGLIEECARKGVKAIHFCTAGFAETDEEEGVRLEAQLVKLARTTGIRLIGPNCMGIYCPQSRISFHTPFPKESGSVGVISQSGGNALSIVSQVRWRGVRFSKMISYGNACDLNESDFLEYLAADDDTKIIALYIEGVKDGRRFRQALQKAAREKVVVLLKGGATEGGARAAAGHTGSLAGSDATWDSLCQQLGVIRVRSLEELVDTLVTLVFMPLPRGRRVALIGCGGGASVLVADDFEKRGLIIPPLPQELRNQIREYTQIAGNIFRNPIDYSQSMREIDNVVKTVGIISRWEDIDSVVGFMVPSLLSPKVMPLLFQMVDGMLEAHRASSKPMAMVIVPGMLPEEAQNTFPLIQKCVDSGLTVYSSYAGAAVAINLVLSHNENRLAKLGT